MSQTSIRLLLLVSLVVSTSAAAAPPAARVTAPVPAKTFTFRIPGEPETLDWNRAHTPIETHLLMNLMEGLLTFDKDLKIVSALAQSWTISSDGLTYTFKLRSGVKWQDGVPLKAQDFVYSWKRLISPLTAASYAYFLFDVEGAEDFNRGKITDFSKVAIRALDDQTFQVKLKNPVAHWIYIPTFWVTFPLRRDVVEKHGDAWASPGRMMTLGPYTLASHDMDSKIVLKANPSYYGKRGNITEVIGLIVKDDSTAMHLYDTGKIDLLTDIATLDLKRLQGRSDLKSFPYLKTGYMGFAVNKYPLTNVKVRRAIAMAVDRSKVGEILYGGQKLASSFIPPQVLGHSKQIGLPYDPLRAKAELREAGLEGTPLSFDLVIPNWDKNMTLAQFIQDQLKKNLGIQVSIQPFDHKTYRAQLDLHAYPVFEGSWSADYPDPDNFLSVFLGHAGNNRTTWKNERYDKLVLQARGLKDAKTREKLSIEAQKILQEEDVVIVPFYYEPNTALVRARVKGLTLNPLNYLLLREISVE